MMHRLRDLRLVALQMPEAFCAWDRDDSFHRKLPKSAPNLRPPLPTRKGFMPLISISAQNRTRDESCFGCIELWSPAVVRARQISWSTRHRPSLLKSTQAHMRKAVLITCYVRYVLDPIKLEQFEIYAKMWIPLVRKLGGTHHGYFLPSEGANNVALALFTFPSLAAYEVYRTKAAADPECQAAVRYYEETRCFLSYERSFFRPVAG
jgi:hypothetical protein